MHEVSVMGSIIETLQQELEKYEFSRVARVRLLVGDLTFLSREALEFAFEAMKKDTPLKDAELVIETLPAIGRCPQCGKELELSTEDDPMNHYVLPSFSCPQCNVDLEIIQGRECYVKDMDLVED